MTKGELLERLAALEKAVAELRAQLAEVREQAAGVPNVIRDALAGRVLGW